MTEQHEHLTRKQYDELKDELAELEGPRRTEVVQAIKTAREFGDLSENFEYHTAKNEQGLLEARIRTLRHRLESSEIVEVADHDIVSVGSALLGKRIGDSVEVQAPRGAWTATITHIH